MIEAIDVHTHIFAPGWPDFAARFGGDRWPRLEGDPATGCKLYLGATFNRNLTPHAFDPVCRIGRLRSGASMMKFLLAAMLLAAGAVVGAGCAGSDRAAREAADRDYKKLSGTWQLTRAVVDGNPVSEAQVKATVLITDGNTFRFPQASGVGTHPAGTFTINPSTLPHQVDSVAIGGPNAGQVTLGIFEIIDDTHKRACWGPAGGPRPTWFEAPPGSRRILQYWEKIGPVPRT